MASKSVFSNTDTNFTVKYWNVRAEAGSIWIHSKKLSGAVENPVKIFSASLAKRVSGAREWERSYRFPLVGTSLSIADLGNPQVLGYALGLSPYILFPVAACRKYQLHIRVSPGASFHSKIYHPTSNPLNLAISSRLNAFIQIGLENGFRLTERMDLGFGLNMMHYSNATVKKPNTGLNITSLYLIFKYQYSTAQNKGTINIVKDKNRTRGHHYNLLLAGANKEIMEPGGRDYLVGILSGEYLFRISDFTLLGGSIDFFGDASSRVVAQNLGISYTNRSELMKIGVSAVAEFKLDKLSLVGHFGVYGYNITKEDNVIYQRIGLRYRLLPQLSAMLGLKGHAATGGNLAVADHYELGIVLHIFAPHLVP